MTRSHGQNMKLILVFALSVASIDATSQSAADVLTRSRSAYQSLASYSDQEEVVNEFGSRSAPTVTKGKITLVFQKEPRKFLFKFTKDNGEQYVIWVEGDEAHSWWSATKVHDVRHDSGGFGTGSLPTLGATVMIPPFLFPRAKMHGPLIDFSPQGLDNDTVEGRECYKITGTEKVGFGKETRPTTVWIERDTLLVRRIVQDTPSTAAQTGSIGRITWTLKPQANPKLSADSFAFMPPK
jgi:hypothetical protein